MHYQDERTYGCRISDAWTYRGLKTVVMENELLRVSLIADKGADMFELVHKPSDTDFMWRTPWSVRNQALWVPSTGWGEGIFHDLYIGGWNTIAPTGGFEQDYMGAEIGQHNETNMMPWDATDRRRFSRPCIREVLRTCRSDSFLDRKNRHAGVSIAGSHGN